MSPSETYELIEFIEGKMRRAGYKQSYLETHDNLQAAIHIYEKCGYKEIDRPKEVVHSTMNRFYIKHYRRRITMGEIERYDVNEEWAHSGIIKAGDFCYLGYCVGNIGGTIEEQINGAFDHMEKRLALVGLTLENVVQMDCLFRDVWNIPVMEKIIKERFNGKYPVRKSIQTEFAHVGGKEGLQFQVDAVAYCG